MPPLSHRHSPSLRSAGATLSLSNGLARRSGAAARPPLPLLEKWLVGLLAAQLVLLPWALGGMYVWARVPSLVLALAALAVALAPRRAPARGEGLEARGGTEEPEQKEASKGKALSYELGARSSGPSGSQEPGARRQEKAMSFELGARSSEPFDSKLSAPSSKLPSDSSKLPSDNSKLQANSSKLIANSPKLSSDTPLVAAKRSEDGSPLVPSLSPGQRLLRWPLFWLGLIFFAYISIQMLNPAWAFRQNERGAWWMVAVPHLTWLPHGVSGMPAKFFPPWLAALPFLSAWLCACAAWVGLTRRRSITTLLTILTINGVLLALFAVVQRVAGNGLMFWVMPPPSGATYFVGPIIYKNHAGAFFNLMVAGSASMGAYHLVRSERHMLKSAPSALFLVLGLGIGAAVILSYSRAATFLFIGFLLLLAGLFIVRSLRNERRNTHPIITWSLLGLLGVFAVVCFQSLKLGTAWDRAEALFKQDRHNSIQMRSTATEATFAMAKDQLWDGHGFGAFRFIFPKYQIQHQGIGVEGGKIRVFWQHAHNDYAEALAELGILGIIPLLGMLLYWGVSLTRKGFWYHPPIWVLMLGLSLTLAHCWVDFHAHNPAILVTWCVLAIVTLRWLQLEEG